ncbi:hypothetical protein A2631_05960 [Candidatus Daviesbacteria bacterium RIFCSPHIGHO2_01_FULL_44_29]|uniref:Uncharacterized protein n=1 Tax=Candidatus Daviesbacteria bacterium RIFCSPHIGHO2_02_FULL_43_12 TaxID=1797776 RepID=A0A1F5KJG2_9BACT|nr:MAG: hypothetical protein A2631_05960 [Candidatus Daviesbacteria bacterium RIFCSPHIGHO2_01_FULL_44_29]OGE39138.1 MAG: hypothetical protein A3E86_03290 [Candidatus Daviesbacteria bacterium RIFCSPHIGHO2_12_FULL_47_45]OGE40940.1 MAG: hypothetical protein A3D25_02790 [Candidatus Daviesbacteria bacterium RIFCSPHIGHO2_02_FULL_43_12]OGE69909.1 MAG: hypothetical protein A3B55_05880 [Candidatus Daviesbacteria bacterium RIFCSPLOWO2_01_FULL_43_15]
MSDPHSKNSLEFADPDENTQDEVAKSEPEILDEQGEDGQAPNPEIVTAKDRLEAAQEMGLYKDADEEHPVEVGINSDSLDSAD